MCIILSISNAKIKNNLNTKNKISKTQIVIILALVGISIGQYQYVDPTSSTSSNLNRNSLYSGLSTNPNGGLYSPSSSTVSYVNSPTGGGGGYSNFTSTGIQSNQIQTRRQPTQSSRNNLYNGMTTRGYGAQNNSQNSGQLASILGFLQTRPDVRKIVDQAFATGNQAQIKQVLDTITTHIATTQTPVTNCKIIYSIIAEKPN